MHRNPLLLSLLILTVSVYGDDSEDRNRAVIMPTSAMELFETAIDIMAQRTDPYLLEALRRVATACQLALIGGVDAPETDADGAAAPDGGSPPPPPPPPPLAPLADARLCWDEAARRLFAGDDRLLAAWRGAAAAADGPLVEPAGNGTHRFRHACFQEHLFCAAVEHREADAFWASDALALRHVQVHQEAPLARG